MTTIEPVLVTDAQAGFHGPLPRAAIFLVATIAAGDAHVERVRAGAGAVAGLVRAVGARDPGGRLSCVVSFGSDAWSRLFGLERPLELHLFHELQSEGRHAPSTPGELLLHICADRYDLCHELGAQVMANLAGSVEVVDEVHGFQYFDDRDLIGFVDGTENPVGAEAIAATIVGEEDPLFAGGSYVTVQKYLHDLTKWDALPIEQQEGVIGRTKLDDIELDDDVKPSFAHNALTKLVVDGREVPILRRNMPFGGVGLGEAGTFFIAYARSPGPVEQMLENMFIGRPPGNYDRLLDFTRPVTGTNFFAPSASFLARLEAGSDESPSPWSALAPGITAIPESADGSLRIGSLRGVPQHE